MIVEACQPLESDVTDYLSAVLAMLGPAENRYADPSAWGRAQEELGVDLPADFKTLVDAYAPIEINGHLSPPPGHRALEPRQGDPEHCPRLV